MGHCFCSQYAEMEKSNEQIILPRDDPQATLNLNFCGILFVVLYSQPDTVLYLSVLP